MSPVATYPHATATTVVCSTFFAGRQLAAQMSCSSYRPNPYSSTSLSLRLSSALPPLFPRSTCCRSSTEFPEVRMKYRLLFWLTDSGDFRSGWRTDHSFVHLPHSSPSRPIQRLDLTRAGWLQKVSFVLYRLLRTALRCGSTFGHAVIRASKNHHQCHHHHHFFFLFVQTF